MLDQQDQFNSLMRRVEDGSDEAIRQLLETYGSHILRTIRRRLNRKMRSQFDSEDFYQAVWASFFTGESMRKFETEQDLVTFLNRVIDECRKQLATKRRQAPRHSLCDSEIQGNLQAKSPRPSQVVSAREQADVMLEGRPSIYRQILELRSGGATYGEIANDTGVSEKTVQRVLKRLEARLGNNG